MNITTFKPNNSILHKYIEYYYDETLEDESYIAYPHFALPTFLSKNVIYNCIDDKVYLSHTNKINNVFSSYNRFKKPIRIIVKGKIYTFNIIFKPYGLAQFIKKSININTKNTVGLTHIFNDFFKLNPYFFELSTEKKIEFLDTYLLSKLQEKKDTDIVIKAIELMENQDLSLTQIAEKCSCNSKKLYRIFQKLCGESPITFKRIIGFRMALEKTKKISSEFNLSDIAIETGYCDQAYFNNIFKKLTKEKPSDFFKKINSFSEENIYFKKIDV